MFQLDTRNQRNPFWNSPWDKELDRFFESFSRPDTYGPACEIIETEKGLNISLDMPGLTAQEIDIEVQDNRLHITGERKSATRSEKENVLRTEKRYGKLSRIFALPQNVKTDAIEARFENGVLEIFLPREEKALPKKIAISSSPAVSVPQ